MKFSSKDLMKAMSLQVGDLVRVANCVYELKSENEYYYFQSVNKSTLFINNLAELVDIEYEILPRPKKYGELKCDNFEGCDYGCPLRWLCCNIMKDDNAPDSTLTLYQLLDFYEVDDEGVYNLFKKRLNKEVELCSDENGNF